MNGPDEIQVQVCRNILETGFSKIGALRLIAGICCTGERGANGIALEPAGAHYELPLPLLANHQWLRPIGRVERVSRVGNTLQFVARMCDVAFGWNGGLWPIREAIGISVFATDRRGTNDFRDWQLHEVSIVDAPMQRGAQIMKAWERSRVVRWDDTPSERILYDAAACSPTTC